MIAQPFVAGVFASSKHRFSKRACACVTLIEGQGVEGDAHCGVTVQHLYDARRNPARPNDRQVHLIQTELLDEVNGQGFSVQPGDLGENVSTRGIDLLALPVGTRLHLGPAAIIEVTGLRHPCRQIDKFQQGLQAAVYPKAASGKAVCRAGVMSVIRNGGLVRPNDTIVVVYPEGPHRPLKPI